MIGARSLAVVLTAAALLAGCAGSPDRTASGTSSQFADCAALTSSPPRVSAVDGTAGKPLPDLELPCFTGGRTVDIGQIRGPAVINLWASWCAPCREELPVLQRLAGRAGVRVHVIGVVSNDDRAAAQSLASALGVTFPAIFDREAFLLGRVGKTALPVTVFVDARSQISYTYNAEPLDDATLTRLIDRYLGVVVPA